jgi:HK97 family phage portal protein
MSWRSTLAEWLDDSPRYSEPQNSGDLPQTPITQITSDNDSWSWMFNKVPGLPSVSEHTAFTISAVYACVNLIAGAISVLPLNLFKRSANDERDQLHNDDLWWLLNEEFLPRWSASNGWEFLVLSLLFHGDAFARIIRNSAQKVIGLEPFHPQRVQVIVTPDRMRLVYAVSPENGSGLEIYDQDEMIHVAGFGFSGTRGFSPLRYHLSMTGSTALATQEFAARFFANGARPDIVITSEQQINKEKAKEIAESWVNNYGGLANAHKPAVLGHGAKVSNLTLSAEDAQLLATRQFQVEEIARIYGVPPWMIGHMQKTTSFGAGVETAGTAFVRFTLRQHLSKIECEINRKLFRTKSRFAEFDTFELERADMKSLFDGFSTALGKGGGRAFLTPDEVRQKLNLKPRGGDADDLAAPVPVDPNADPNADKSADPAAKEDKTAQAPRQSKSAQ